MQPDDSIYPSKCRPEFGLFCRPLAQRVRPMGPFGGGFTPVWAQRSPAPGQEPEPPKFMGIAYKVPGLLSDPGIMLEKCCFCGESILRTDVDKPIEQKREHNTGHSNKDIATIEEDYQI